MLLAQMRLCQEYGIPHSTLLEWEPEDRDLAMAYIAYTATACQRCGTHPEDWVDEDGKPLEPPPYVAASVKCYGCATLEEARAQAGEAAKDQSLTFKLRKVSRKLTEKAHRKWQMRRSK